MKATLFALLTLSVLATGASAQVFSDNFDTDTQQLATNTLLNWDITRDNVDVVGTGGLYDFYPGNGNFLDMAGTPGFGRITTKTSFALTPGTYNLSFLLGKNGNFGTTMDVSVGSLFSTTLSDALTYASFVPQSFDFTVISPTTATITFDYPDNGSNTATWGYVIDNVALTQTSTAAPEPGTIALLALGGMVALKRRRSA